MNENGDTAASGLAALNPKALLLLFGVAEPKAGVVVLVGVAPNAGGAVVTVGVADEPNPKTPPGDGAVIPNPVENDAFRLLLPNVGGDAIALFAPPKRGVD